MSNDFTEVLKNRLYALAADIASMQSEIQELFQQIGLKQDQAQSILKLLAAEGENLDGQDLVALGSVPISDVAFEYLDESEGKNPIHYGDLCDTIMAGGIFIPGKNPAANLLSHISRDERFVRVAPGTYGLSKWGLDPYQPIKRKRRASRKK